MIKEILNLFSNEYKEETDFLEVRDSMKDKIYLKNDEKLTEEEKIARFSDIDTSCRIDVGAGL